MILLSRASLISLSDQVANMPDSYPISYLIASLILLSSHFKMCEALHWKEKGPELNCDVTCGGSQSAVSDPTQQNSLFVPYVCAVSGSNFDTFSTGTQVGTAFFVSNVLSCWVYSNNPGGPSSTAHNSWFCLCTDPNDHIKNVTGSTAMNCSSSCMQLSSAGLNSTLASCQSPTIEPICFDSIGHTFGYQNASSKATDYSCLTVSLAMSDTPGSPSAARPQAFSCLCASATAVANVQISGNCSTSSSISVAAAGTGPAPAQHSSAQQSTPGVAYMYKTITTDVVTK
jgi:hypothetical protein